MEMAKPREAGDLGAGQGGVSSEREASHALPHSHSPTYHSHESGAGDKQKKGKTGFSDFKARNIQFR